MHKIEERIKEAGLALPAAPEPIANYVSVQKAGELWFFSGAGPFKDGKPVMFGRLGEDMDTEEGYQAARLTGLNLLSVLKRELCGDWDRLEQVVKLQGFVNSAAAYYEQPAVLNGASDLFYEILGEKGRHARTAVAVNVLPMNISVEVEMIVKVKNEAEKGAAHDLK